MVEDSLIEQTLSKVLEDYTKNGLGYIEAITEVSKNFNIEVEVLGDIIRRSNVLTAKVRMDAEELNLIEKTSRLPI